MCALFKIKLFSCKHVFLLMKTKANSESRAMHPELGAKSHRGLLPSLET